MKAFPSFRTLLPCVVVLALAVSNPRSSLAASKKTADNPPPAKTAALVDINTATAAQLEQVPGIGSTYAQKIIAKRPYATLKDLSKTGIPASRLEKMLPQLTVTQKAAASDKPAENVPPATTPKPKTARRSSTAAAKPAETDTKPAEVAARQTTDAKPAEKTAGQKTANVARTPPKKGMVWANSDSKVYHVEGDRWYGKTKKGEWMTEEDALKAGYRKSK